MNLNYSYIYILNFFFLIFYISGYDIIFLNDDNLLLNLFFFLLFFFFLKIKFLLMKLNKYNKNVVLKEYYYNFLLIKVFLNAYLRFLGNIFNTCFLQYKYFNFFLKWLSYTNFLSLSNMFFSYIIFFFNYLNSQKNYLLLKYIQLKYLSLLNIHYIMNILKLFRIN